jgi:putative tryptophan/tyrosine transport system substrate-binding protein
LPQPAASPIVFTSVGDPVGAGLIASLSQPGANATGLSAQASDITAMRLQLLKDLIPGKKLIAVLGPYTALALQQVRTAGAVMGQLLAVFEARTVDQLPTAIHEAIMSGADFIIGQVKPVFIGFLFGKFTIFHNL